MRINLDIIPSYKDIKYLCTLNKKWAIRDLLSYKILQLLQAIVIQLK